MSPSAPTAATAANALRPRPRRRFQRPLTRPSWQIAGAGSRGQRDAASNGLFTEADNLETEYGQAAVNTILINIAKADTPITYDKWLEQTNAPLLNEKGEYTPKTVPQFLNFILSCDLGFDEDGPQNRLMDALMDEIAVQVQRAKDANTFDFGLRTLRGANMHVSETRVIHTTTDAIETSLTTVTADFPATRHTYGHVLSRVRTSRERYGGDTAYFAYNSQNQICAVYRNANSYHRGNEVKNYAIAFPSHVTHTEYIYGMRKISDDDAHDAWNTALETVAETYEASRHLITGAILPIIRLLPADLKAVIAQTTSGERILGIELDLAAISSLTEQLGTTAVHSTATVLEEITKRNVHAIYDGEIKVTRVRFGNEWRVEIIVPRRLEDQLRTNYAAAGVTVERVSYQTRFFLPIDGAADVLERAMTNHTLTKIAA